LGEDFVVQPQTTEQLVAKKCVPCEGGVPAYSQSEAQQQIAKLNGWELTNDGKRIRKKWTAKNFMAAMDFFNRVANLAEDEQHHPDLHLESYRQITIDLSTHAIDGLSENDFILAAKIDELPIETKKSS
jgi:4a-hydroxytetrahydrobiopterin dehydratase